MQYTRPSSRQKNKTASYLILLIVLVIFLSTVGVKLLIGTSVFINKLVTGGKITDTRHTDKLRANPEIIDVPDATHSAQINITIVNVENTNISIIVNNLVQNDLFSDEDSIDTEVELDPGENTIQIEAKDPDSKEMKKSRLYRTTYLENKPELEITSPTDNTITDKQEIVITGKVGESIDVTINGLPVVISGDGTFSSSVKLVNGENKVTIVASNVAGTTESQTITVRYEP